jgi:hypothetical protein
LISFCEIKVTLSLYGTLTPNDEVGKNGEKESNTEDDRPRWAIKMPGIASANQSYTMLIDGPAINLETDTRLRMQTGNGT